MDATATEGRQVEEHVQMTSPANDAIPSSAAQPPPNGELDRGSLETAPHTGPASHISSPTSLPLPPIQPISSHPELPRDAIHSQRPAAHPETTTPDHLRQELRAEDAMADNQIKEGDQVSWQWGSGAPGGEATEVKTQGEVTMQTKNNNEVKKNAEPNNPAVYVERSGGHDVVKKASELEVEEKGPNHKEGGGSSEEKKDDEGEKKENGEAATGDKRKAEDTAEEKKDEEDGDAAKKQKTDEEKPKENGDAPKKKGRPAKKDANGNAAPKKEAKKREPKKAATATGEPRRSGRNASKSS